VERRRTLTESFGFPPAMFDEPEEQSSERIADPLQRAREKFDEFRMHAELAAVFEGCRKFDAELKPGLDADLARDVQKRIAKLEKAKTPDVPLIAPEAADDAGALLRLPTTNGLSTNDYHIQRRPGEALVIRWLSGDRVETFYDRFQAHFDAALKHYREEERQSKGWKQDADTLKYLEALDAFDVKMADRYLRQIIRQHKVFVLSTQTADEIDILHLCDYLMGVDAADLVGKASSPPDEPTERDRAWFFKLFSLRGIDADQERMCFFTYLQKAEETFEL
jgi:hypothetical protein